MVTKEKFSKKAFLKKVDRYARKAGREVIEKAFLLYFAVESPDTPMWAKGVIYSTLVYFVNPIDAIPDVTPIAGFTDDLGAIMGSMAMVAVHITPEIKKKAKQRVSDLFD